VWVILYCKARKFGLYVPDAKFNSNTLFDPIGGRMVRQILWSGVTVLCGCLRPEALSRLRPRQCINAHFIYLPYYRRYHKRAVDNIEYRKVRTTVLYLRIFVGSYD